MITSNNFIARIESLVRATIEALDYELVRVTYEPEDGAMALTLFINHASGITLDDCEKVSLTIDPIIEASGIMESEENWTLNVSSPGVS